MGLRSGLPHLGPPRRCVAALAAPIQLASAAQQSKIKSAHQPPRSDRGQPVEAPQLALPFRSSWLLDLPLLLSGLSCYLLSFAFSSASSGVTSFSLGEGSCPAG